MATHSPVLDQLNLVCADVDLSVTFYRHLGLVIPEEAIWRTGTGAHHVEIKMGNGVELGLDSEALANVYNGGNPPPTAGRKQAVISFRMADADAVDTLYSTLEKLGYTTAQPPYFTFWGSRYAIVEDPDGNQVGLMSPPDPARRTRPPEI